MNFFHQLEFKIFTYLNSSYLLYLPQYNSLYRINSIARDILLHIGQGFSGANIISSLSAKYPKEDIIEAIGELKIIIKKESSAYPNGIKLKFLSPLKKYNIKKLELYLSSDCNMSCSYCFEKGGKYGLSKVPKKMSWTIARKTIDWFFDINKDEKEALFIHFFGGEPLLNKRVLQNILEYIRRKTDSSHIPAVYLGIATNGTLLTRKTIKILAKYNCMPWISLDASKKSHNLRRVYKNGMPTYDDVISGIKRFKAIAPQLPMVLSTTLGKHDSLSGIIKLQEKLGIEMKEFRLEFSLYEKDIFPDKDFYSRLKKMREEMEYLYKRQIKKGKYINILDQSSFYRLHTKRHGFSGCGAGKNRVTVISDGSMFICSPGMYYYNIKMGHVLSGIKLESVRSINELYRKHLKVSADCVRCWARKLCSGQCVLSGVNTSAREGENRWCDYRRFVNEYVLKSYFSLDKETACRMFVKDKRTEKFIEEMCQKIKSYKRDILID